MTVEMGKKELLNNSEDDGIKRRMIIRFGTVAAGIAGASTLSSLMASGAGAAMHSPPGVMTTLVPTATTDPPPGYVLRSLSGPECRIEDVNAMKLGARKATTWVTPDGTGVVVHPSVLYFPNGFNGYCWWAAITPYFNSNNQVENPIIQVSKDGTTWFTPTGVTNPLYPPRKGGYNSDTHLIQHPHTGELLLYFRDYSAYPDALNENIMLMRSADGITWSTAVRALSLSEGAKRLMCPVVWWSPTDDKWVMLGVEIVASPRVIERYTATDPAGPFVLDRIAAVPQGWPVGTSPWHFDAKPVGNQIVSLMQTGTSGSGGGATWLMVSDDEGRTFTRATDPLVTAGTYRPCFVPRFTERGLALDTFIGGTPPNWGVTRGLTCVSAVTATVVPSIIASEAETILAARAALPPWLVGDAFARADAASLGTADTGQTWTSSSGTFKIVGKAAIPATATNTRSYVETGTADHWATVMVAANPAGDAFLIARLMDGLNYYRATLTANSVILHKVVAGSVTVLSTTALSPVPPTNSTIGIRCVGSTVEVYTNGSLASTVTDTDLVGTKVGIQASAIDRVFRNFRVRTS